MDTTSDTTRARGSWDLLPAELVGKIIEMLAWPNAETQSDKLLLPIKPKACRLAQYSVVSRLWQSHIEPILYKRLTLNQHDVDALGRIVTERRAGFVQYVWLRLVFPAYGCTKNEKGEPDDEDKVHNQIYTNALWKLFEAMSSPSWTRNRVHDTKGITLELSAHSEDDTRHTSVSGLRQRMDDTAWGVKDDSPFQYLDSSYAVASHRSYTRPQSAGRKGRLFGNPRGLSLDRSAAAASVMGQELPEVSTVHALVIRRQFYRAFSTENGLAEVFRSLTGLQEFTYEPWRGPPRDLCGPDGVPAVQNTPDNPHAQLKYIQWARLIRDCDHGYLYGEVLKEKPSLKKVSIYENFGDVFYVFRVPSHTGHVSRNYHPCKALGRHLARSSRNLEELHASHNIDALDFFKPDPHLAAGGPDAGLEWKNLKYLSLTSRHLMGPEPRPGDDDTVICWAARRAELMPRLEIMELWGGLGSGKSAIFRFERRDRQPRIKLLTTEPRRITSQEKARWQSVVDRFYPGLGVWLMVEETRLRTTTIPAKTIQGPDTEELMMQESTALVDLLVLKDRLLHPVSLVQKRKELRRRVAAQRQPIPPVGPALV